MSKTPQIPVSTIAMATTSRIPHRVGLLLAAIVFPLIWVGGLVTTYDAGMAVPDWPGTYGYNMFLYPIESWLSGPFDLFVEHGHRLLASLAGLISIGLVWVTCRHESRKFVQYLAIMILGMVGFQGFLGGARVVMDARVIAKVHGCVGPLFFALVIAFCVVTSRWWNRIAEQESNTSDRRALSRAGAAFAGVLLLGSFCQLVIGAFLRHATTDSSPSSFRGLVFLHIGMAGLLVLGTVVQWLVSWASSFRGRGLRASINVLTLLILGQFCLGAYSYVLKWGWPAWLEKWNTVPGYVIGEKTFIQMNLVTAHMAMGSLILAFWVVHAVRCARVRHCSKLECVSQTDATDVEIPSEDSIKEDSIKENSSAGQVVMAPTSRLVGESN